jgi:hypothetical protein
MAIDSVSERFLAFSNGLDAVEPQIRGCRHRLNDEISPDLKAAYQIRLEFLLDRHAKLVAARNAQFAADGAMEILENDDGFPAIPPMELSVVLMEELAEEGAADDAAAAGFVAIPPAAKVSISLGTPTDKPVAGK